MSRPVHTHALVTGASSGIGLQLSRRLGARGIHVVVAARRLDALEAVVDQIRGAGGTAEALVLDVEDPDRTEAIVRARAEARPFDLVVANAGIFAPTGGRNPRWADAKRVLTVNLLGAAATLYGALPAMLAAGRGHLVGVSSLAGQGRAFPRFGAYSASKTALTTFLEGLAIDLAGRVHVTTVMPGFVRTPMTAPARFKMPFLIEVERAADLMDAAIARGDRTCAFPLPTAAVSWTLPLLPARWYEGMVRRASRRR